MKLLAPCPTCTSEPSAAYAVDLAKDQTFELRCSEGHAHRCLWHVPRYELLFESGMLALVDNYPREAVTSFAVAVERFYEFWLQAVLAQRGVEEPAWQASWKQVKQSERQVGAFILIYRVELGKSAPLLPDDPWVKFRNNVVHAGYWPSAAEAQEYGEVVVSYLCPLARELAKHSPKGVSEVLRRQRVAAKADVTMRSQTTLGRATALTRATFKLGRDLQQLRRRQTGLVHGSSHS